MKSLLTLLLAFLCLNSYGQIKHIAKEVGLMMEKPDMDSPMLGQIKIGDTISVISFKDNYWKIKKGSITGYISLAYMSTTPDICPLNPGCPKSNTYDWPMSIKIGIVEGELTHLIGYPTTINKTETANITYLQYVYRKEGEKTKYYYFENGSLVSWQE